MLLKYNCVRFMSFFFFFHIYNIYIHSLPSHILTMRPSWLTKKKPHIDGTNHNNITEDNLLAAFKKLVSHKFVVLEVSKGFIIHNW